MPCASQDPRLRTVLVNGLALNSTAGLEYGAGNAGTLFLAYGTTLRKPGT